MKKTFDDSDPEDRNLVAKLSNTVVDLNFYAYRFLIKAGYLSSPRSGLQDAEDLIFQGVEVPSQIGEILFRYSLVLKANPETANDLFYDTWTFLHNYDKTLNNV